MLIAQTAHTSQAQEILQGAAELFLRYGVKSITMDEIARHISVSKKTIYQKDDKRQDGKRENTI